MFSMKYVPLVGHVLAFCTLCAVCSTCCNKHCAHYLNYAVCIFLWCSKAKKGQNQGVVA